VLELSADIASLYVCNYVEPDGRCRPGRSIFLVISRHSRHSGIIPHDVLALYAYQASSLCIDQFDAQLHNITTTDGTTTTTTTFTTYSVVAMGRLKTRDWKTQDWKTRDQVHRGGKRGTGKHGNIIRMDSET